MKIDVLISTKDRPVELAMLLNSLDFQTHDRFDVVIIDGSAGDQRNNQYVIRAIQQLERNGHEVLFERIDIPGVLATRQKAQELSNKEWVLRVDDDVILHPKYIENLIMTHFKDDDPETLGIVSGITPMWGVPMYYRAAEKVHADGIINKLEIEDGKIMKFGDDCGFDYDLFENPILNAGHFRSCALHRRNLWDYTDFPLSLVGFREETMASLIARWKGYRIKVNLKAKAWHFQSSEGGCRYPNYADIVKSDDNAFQVWVSRKVKQYGGNPKC